MVDTLHEFGVQILVERFKHYHFSDGTDSALLLAAGLDVDSLLNSILGKTPGGVDRHLDARDWLNLVQFGLHPAEAASHGLYVKLGGSEYKAHPVQIAAMWGRCLNDTTKAQLCIDEYLRCRDEHKAGPTSCRPNVKVEEANSAYYTWKEATTPPDPESMGCSRIEYDSHYDTVYFLNWFHDRCIPEIMESARTAHEIGQLVTVSAANGGRWDTELRHGAYAVAKKLIQGKGTSRNSYEEVSRILTRCNGEDARLLITKASGTQVVYGVVRHDASTDMMVQGLRATTSMSDKVLRHILPYMGRSPTLDEFRNVRRAGLINVLYFMPWALLEPIVVASGNELRGLLLGKYDSTDLNRVRNCLVNHNNRLEPKHPVVSNPNAVNTNVEVGMTTQNGTPGTRDDWYHFYRGIAGQYMDSVRVREALLAITGDPVVSMLSLLGVFDVGGPHIERVMSTHPRIEEIEAIVASYKPVKYTRY